MSTVTDPTPPAPPPADPLAPDWGPARSLVAVATGVGFGLFALGLGLLPVTSEGETHLVREALAAWLVGWTYWFSLPLGGLALLMIHYLVKSSWGLLLRRPLEAAAKTLPVMAVLFAPIGAAACLPDEQSPYWWTHPSHAEHAEGGHDPATAAGAHDDHPADPTKDAFDAVREKKFRASEEAVRTAIAHEQREQFEETHGFLSAPVFLGVAVVLFVIWGVLIHFLTKWSDEMARDPAKVDASWEKLKNLSGPGLIIYAITITVAATQWVMSLQPGWASTMYPVIFAVNQFLTCLAFCVAVFLLLVGRPPFQAVMRPKFQLDMASLMLGLTLFWAYTSFSQTMLIWIGNLPEEIPYYLKRSSNTPWWWVSGFLIAFHFALPFLLLLYRDIKLHPVRLRVMAVYLLAVIAVDVTWWIQPTWVHSSPLFVLTTVGAILGVGGLWGMAFLFFLSRRPLLPANETYLLPEGHEGGHHDGHH